MLKLFSGSKESSTAATEQPPPTTSGSMDITEPQQKNQSFFKTLTTRIFARSDSPPRETPVRRRATRLDPEFSDDDDDEEDYDDYDDQDVNAFKTPLEPLPEVHPESEASKMISTPGFTAYYLRFDPTRHSNPPPALPRLDRPLSAIQEVNTPTPPEGRQQPSPISPEESAHAQIKIQTCSSCGLQNLECAKANNPSGANPMRALNVNVHIEEIDRFRLATYIWKQTRRLSPGTREGENHVVMYLKHRQEVTDKRVELRIGFERNAANENRRVVSFLCETKKAEIIAYLGEHAARVRSGTSVSAYLYEIGGVTMFGVAISQS